MAIKLCDDCKNKPDFKCIQFIKTKCVICKENFTVYSEYKVNICHMCIYQKNMCMKCKKQIIER